MKLNIEDIKRLREMTGAGVGDCRAALEESNGNMEEAIKKLQVAAAKKADKKSEREVKAGFVFSYVHHTGKVGCLVALACETDFVAKNEAFAKLGKEIALQVASNKPETVEELLAQEYIRDGSKTVNDLIKEAIGKIGENIQLVGIKVMEI